MREYKVPNRVMDLGFVVLGGVMVWYVTRNLARLGDGVVKTTELATKPIASLISDVMAGYNGWEAVQLAPLMIRREYLTPEYALNADAESVLWGIDEYQPMLRRLFGGRGGTLKPEYHALIDVPIEG